MRKIKLTNGRFAFVDTNVWRKVRRLNWMDRGHGYVCSTQKYNRVYLHRFVLGLKKGKGIVDHINGNPYDNRRRNLRVATKSQNNQNQKVRPSSRTGYKGVYVHRGNKWTARIRANGIYYYLGVFACPLQAAEAYNTAAIRFFGRYACINDIPKSKKVLTR